MCFFVALMAEGGKIMTKSLYVRKRNMLLVGMLIMIIFTLVEPCLVSKAKGLGTGIETIHSSDTSTGVTELDDAMARGDKMGNGVIKFIGKWVARLGLIFFLISFPSHQAEMRIISFIGFVVGLAMYFGPEIVDAILGK